MNHDNILLLVYRICNKKTIFSFNDVEYVLCAPSYKIKYSAELYYQKIWEENKYNDWVLKENLGNVLAYIGIWNDLEEKNLQNIEKEIDNLKLSLYMNRLNTKQTESTRTKLKNKRQHLNSLIQKKHSFDHLTLEDFCASAKNEYILSKTLRYRCNKKLVFNNIDAETDSVLFRDIASYITNLFISIDKYKQIARSEYWRNIWNANKNNIFNEASCNMSDEQKTLVNISHMYDRIFEHPECPESSVIEDDDMLDGWMIYQKQQNENKNKKDNSLTSKHPKAQEIFVVSDDKDSQNIYNLNDNNSRKKIAQRSNIIQQKQEINDFDLPDVQNSIRLRENTIAKKR